MQFHAVARSVLGLYRLVLARDGSLLVVSGHDSVAGARAGARALEQDTDWQRLREDHGFMVRAVGGSWPDAVYITGDVLGAGPDPQPEVVVRRSGNWTFLGIPSPQGTVAYYASYHSLSDGRLLAVRVQEREGRTYAPPEEFRGRTAGVRPAAPRKLAAPAWDVLIAGAGPPPPPPPPPPGGDVEDLELLPDGDLVVLLPGPKVLRAAPGAPRWTAMPAPTADAGAYPHIGSLAVSPDGLLYVHGCGKRGPTLARWDERGWQAIVLPGDACLYSLAVAGDGTLWISQNGLHRRRASGGWERVTITVDGFDRLDDRTAAALVGPDGTLWVSDLKVAGGSLMVTTQAGWSALDLDLFNGQSVADRDPRRIP